VSADSKPWGIKLILAVLIALTLFPVYHAAKGYLDQRAAKKATLEEYWRREHLPPEQRIAEDKAKEEAARRAKADADEAARIAEVTARLAEERAHNAAAREKTAKLEALGRAACLTWWRRALHDPDSAKLVEADGVFGDDTYHGWITGRAKNGFGAYITATWDCHLRIANETIMPVSLTQRRIR
jgi:hypothetical protein